MQQVRIALRGARPGMTQIFADRLQRETSIDRKRGVGMAKVMNPEIGCRGLGYALCGRQLLLFTQGVVCPVLHQLPTLLQQIRTGIGAFSCVSDTMCQ